MLWSGRWRVQKEFVAGLLQADALLAELVDPAGVAERDSKVLSSLQQAAMCVYDMVAGGVAPQRHWPELLTTAGASGLWSSPIPLLSFAELQEILVAFEVTNYPLPLSRPPHTHAHTRPHARTRTHSP